MRKLSLLLILALISCAFSVVVSEEKEDAIDATDALLEAATNRLNQKIEDQGQEGDEENEYDEEDAPNAEGDAGGDLQENEDDDEDEGGDEDEDDDEELDIQEDDRDSMEQYDRNRGANRGESGEDEDEDEDYDYDDEDDEEYDEDDDEAFTTTANRGDSAEVRNLKEKLQFMKDEHDLDTKFQRELVEQLKQLKGELEKVSGEVKDPQLSEWILKRSQNMGEFLASKRIGRAFEDNLKKLMKRTQKMKQDLDNELLPVVGVKFSQPIAQFVIFLMLLLPLSFILYGVYRSYVVFSVRQYILVGHLSNLIFLLSSLILYSTLGRDPFGALVDSQHEMAVVITQLWLALQYLGMILLILFALLASKTRFQRLCFLSQIVLMTIVGIDYRKRVYIPVVQGLGTRASGIGGLLAYLFYTIAVCSMIVVTVKTAKVSRNEVLVREVDAVLDLLTCADSQPEGTTSLESTHKEV
mmetsp:Transcript_33568/g.132453  ORF Transcript_33568/g.132453 Transcript_33568/m.132453 type:complete len:469 (-) Transcript_33568:411-1817(-)|eukprot:CAMPEP_0113967560 /NCGR_PEP_ID=MMETSP0011_2-20120614/9010_1 /TAXON_ID=101924 /ORGANISM="Rhodosorus marinus" /LENGTH=468 /DNA_ID=CAMNT_0000980481 /DNA_START=355 /DNA_END=1761 /DNA_ORIENTATION=- /assembly_acc=CAM_ASM_000156